MNRLITDSVTLNNGQPITDKTIPFIEDGVQEAISNVVQSLIGEPYTTGDVIILYGVEFSVSGNNMTYTDGAIYYNGEVYTVVGASITKTTPQTFVITNTPNFVNSIDPIYFEDGSQVSVHQVRQIQIIGGTAGGSGVTDYLCDYLDVKSAYSNDAENGVISSSDIVFTAIRSQSSATITNVFAGSETKKTYATKANGIINITTEISFQADAVNPINLGRLQLDLSPKYEGIWADVNKTCSFTGMARTTNSSTPPTHIFIDPVDDSNNISNSVLRITVLGLTVFPNVINQSTILTFNLCYKAKTSV